MNGEKAYELQTYHRWFHMTQGSLHSYCCVGWLGYPIRIQTRLTKNFFQSKPKVQSHQCIHKRLGGGGGSEIIAVGEVTGMKA
jgi:hypothetical protein